jgi:hypothetical protein
MMKVEIDDDQQETFGISGHRGISYFTVLMFTAVVVVGLYFDIAFLPLYIPTLGLVICWFRHFRKKIPLDGLLFIYFLGFLGYGFLTIMYQLVVSLILGSIFPHDVTQSTNYIVSNLLYSIMGGAFATELSRYLLISKIKRDSGISEAKVFLFSAIVGSVAITTLLLVLGNTGSLLKRVHDSLQETQALQEAVIVRSIFDMILQILLSYRISVNILRHGLFSLKNGKWIRIILLNYTIQVLSIWSFFVIGVMRNWWGLLLVYLASILITAVLIKSEKRTLSVSFDPTSASTP